MNKYYVYFHVDPDSKQIVYVGYGSNHRAWVFNAIVFRQKPHLEYLHRIVNQGYLPSDWVLIRARGLSKQEALKLEKEMIELYDPEYNNHKGTYSLTDKTKIKDATALRAQGLSFSKIADEMNLKSAMTAWRYCDAGR